MRGLEITQQSLVNQQGVVKEEVKGAMFTTPYGCFPGCNCASGQPELAERA